MDSLANICHQFSYYTAWIAGVINRVKSVIKTRSSIHITFIVTNAGIIVLGRQRRCLFAFNSILILIFAVYLSSNIGATGSRKERVIVDNILHKNMLCGIIIIIINRTIFRIIAFLRF